MKEQVWKILFCLVLFLILSCTLFAQFPPAAGQPGSTAIYVDSSAFVNWAKTCSVELGYIDISDTSLYYAGSNKANYGIESDACGKADNHVISLGDGGVATLTFDPAIKNGPGNDFAVFENGLSDEFLELAFVEVSSDGINYFRIPCTSLTQDTSQISTFGLLDPKKINNIAGKYKALHGTPFDIDTLKGLPGLDVGHVTHVRIIDVVGSIDAEYATYDDLGNKVNDPWTTPFNTGGFDLDALGVINEVALNIQDPIGSSIQIFPNPASENVSFNRLPVGLESLRLFNSTGVLVLQIKNPGAAETISLLSLSGGVYNVIFTFSDGRIVNRKIIKI